MEKWGVSRGEQAVAGASGAASLISQGRACRPPPHPHPRPSRGGSSQE